MQALMYSYNSGFPLVGGLGAFGRSPPPPKNLADTFPQIGVSATILHEKHCFCNFHAVFGDSGLSDPPHQRAPCRKPYSLKKFLLLFDQ